MSVTINDVANEAGVSKSTVSKVLNHWTTISPATVEKVHAAIEKLHYTPNSRAVSFAKGATSNIVYLTWRKILLTGIRICLTLCAAYTIPCPKTTIP